MFKKNVLKLLMCIGVFSMLFATKAFASGSFNSTYSITSPCCRVGTLTGSTHFTVSSNSRTISITLSNSTHNAGGVNISLQRRGVIGWGGAGTSALFSANATRSLTSGDSGTYRLFMWNELNGDAATGQTNGSATNSGNIRVSH